MQIVIDDPDKLVYITDLWDASEWPGIWAQVPSDYRVDTYDIWPDDVIAQILNEGRTQTCEVVAQYTNIFINGQWQIIGINRNLCHFSPVNPIIP